MKFAKNSREGVAATKSQYKLFIIAPTCFYYQVSIFRKLAADPRFDLKVYFCSDEAFQSQDVLAMYNTEAKWGGERELLLGFEYNFLRNYSPRPSYLKWPFGLMNFGIWPEIRKQRPDIVILMSWMNITWWTAILACLIHNVPFLYLTDANIQGESTGSRWKRRIKQLLLGKLLFPLVAGFLCAGKENEDLYRSFGVPNEKLIPYAYSWGYDSLLQCSQDVLANREKFRCDLGIPKGSKVVLFCGRLSSEKNPFHLLEAYHRVNNSKKVLLFVGDGELKESLEEYTADRHLESVHFLGFQSREAMPKFYAAADMLVLPSRQETWGIVVNEAMCFRLPVIVSNQVGAGRDLVKVGYNGFSFPAGDVSQLARHIGYIFDLGDEEKALMGDRSLEMITEWMERDLCGSLLGFLDNLYSGKN